MRMPFVILLALAFATPSFAQDANLKQLADIQAASIAKSSVGTWVKIRDANGKEVRITLVKKEQAGAGWNVTSSFEPGGQVQSVVGSVDQLAKLPDKVTSVKDEPLSIAGKQYSCKVITYASGQKAWYSADIPLGGSAKVVGAKGEAFFTLLDVGSNNAAAAAPTK